MNTKKQKQALIIGASSGIGEALARRLVQDGWKVAVAARRIDLLQALAHELGTALTPYFIDVGESDGARDTLEKIWRNCEQLDLVIVSAGTGHANQDLAWGPERETIEVNVLGFAAVAGAAMSLLIKQGFGHLAGVSSIARFVGDGEAPAYGASKAFVSVYLDNLRALAKHKKLPIYVTELCPGYVHTAMMKTDKAFWVATPEKAAAQMLQAIRRRTPCAYITRRWALIAWLLRLLRG